MQVYPNYCERLGKQMQVRSSSLCCQFEDFNEYSLQFLFSAFLRAFHSG